MYIYILIYIYIYIQNLCARVGESERECVRQYRVNTK